MDSPDDTRPVLTPRIAQRIASLQAAVTPWLQAAVRLDEVRAVVKLLSGTARVDYTFGARGFPISPEDEREGLKALAVSRCAALVAALGADPGALDGAVDVPTLFASWAQDDREAGRRGASSASFAAVRPGQPAPPSAPSDD